ncbi:hypothetical protein PFI31113_04983 [Pandoraea fibrosis]|uniref:Uncharacterized protein n=1 Tax=Pandoraea fibrosis TaxID=1891094 RepID=A0A5E4Z5N7_9BURK|nr:hypothetical protein PFI31113_04983 [Pandoraea fibrosis]
MDLAPDKLALCLLDTRLDRCALGRRVALHAELVRAQIQRAGVRQVSHARDVLVQRNSTLFPNSHGTCTQRFGVSRRQCAAINAQARHTALIARQRQIARADLGQFRANGSLRGFIRGKIRMHETRQGRCFLLLGRQRLGLSGNLALEMIVLIQRAEDKLRVTREHIAVARQRTDGECFLRCCIGASHIDIRDGEHTTVHVDRGAVGGRVTAHTDRPRIDQGQVFERRILDGYLPGDAVNDSGVATFRILNGDDSEVDNLGLFKIGVNDANQ